MDKTDELEKDKLAMVQPIYDKYRRTILDDFEGIYLYIRLQCETSTEPDTEQWIYENYLKSRELLFKRLSKLAVGEMMLKQLAVDDESIKPRYPQLKMMSFPFLRSSPGEFRGICMNFAESHGVSGVTKEQIVKFECTLENYKPKRDPRHIHIINEAISRAREEAKERAKEKVKEKAINKVEKARDEFCDGHDTLIKLGRHKKALNSCYINWQAKVNRIGRFFMLDATAVRICTYFNLFSDFSIVVTQDELYRRESKRNLCELFKNFLRTL